MANNQTAMHPSDTAASCLEWRRCFLLFTHCECRQMNGLQPEVSVLILAILGKAQASPSINWNCRRGWLLGTIQFPPILNPRALVGNGNKLSAQRKENPTLLSDLQPHKPGDRWLPMLSLISLIEFQAIPISGWVATVGALPKSTVSFDCQHDQFAARIDQIGRWWHLVTGQSNEVFRAECLGCIGCLWRAVWPQQSSNRLIGIGHAGSVHSDRWGGRFVSSARLKESADEGILTTSCPL